MVSLPEPNYWTGLYERSLCFGQSTSYISLRRTQLGPMRRIYQGLSAIEGQGLHVYRTGMLKAANQSLGPSPAQDWPRQLTSLRYSPRPYVISRAPAKISGLRRGQFFADQTKSDSSNHLNFIKFVSSGSGLIKIDTLNWFIRQF